MDIRQEIGRSGNIIYHVDAAVRVYVEPDFSGPVSTDIQGFTIRLHAPTDITPAQAQGLAHALHLARKACQKANATWKGRPFWHLLAHYVDLRKWHPASA